MKKSIRCVIFDMDGCLVNSERKYIEGWMSAFKSQGIPITHETIEDWAGHGLTWINEQVDSYTHNHDTTLQLRAHREAYFYDQLNQGKVELMPYAQELLDYIRAQGLSVGVATCTLAEKGTSVLAYHHLLDWFDFTVFGDEVEQFKPAPDLYLKAIERSGFHPDECIVFEDSTSGVAAANAAGLNVIFVPDLKKNKDAQDVPYQYRVENFRDGIEILKNLLAD